jgi:hypothetical protein
MYNFKKTIIIFSISENIKAMITNTEIEDCLREFLPIRAKIYKIAWKRIAEAFPELELWLVDTENKRYERTPWSYWLEYNK